MANTSDQNPEAGTAQGAMTSPGDFERGAVAHGGATKAEEPELFVEDALAPEELEELEGLNTLTMARTNPDDDDDDDDVDEEGDLLSTLEMPVFRMPGAEEVEEVEESRSLPLSGILRGRRKRSRINDEPIEAAPSLLPFVVIRPPVGFDKPWHDGLPEGEAKRLDEAARERVRAAGAPALKASATLPVLSHDDLMAFDGESPSGPTVPISGLTEDDLESLESGEVEALAHPPVPQPSPPPIEPPRPPAALSAPPPPKAAPPSKPPIAAQAPAPSAPPQAALAPLLAIAAPPTAIPPTAPPAKAPPGKGELSDIVQELIDESERPEPSRNQTAPHSPPEHTWYRQIFTEEYFRTLPLGFHKQTRRESQFILNSLSVGQGGRILDMCCGFGRHTIELAKRGYDMVGLDLSLPLLQKALGEAQRRKLSIKFIHGDVRELNFNGAFDAAFCFHTSFGYFDDKTNFQILTGVFQSLKPGGRFLLEILNRDFAIQKLPDRKWWEGSDCLFLEEVTFNYQTSVLHNKRTFIYDDNRPPWEQYIYIRLFSLHEIQSLLRMAGFNCIEVSGSLASRGAFFGTDSPHLLLLAERPR